MKRFSFLIYLLPCLILLTGVTSCKKESNKITLDGVVADPNSGGTVESAKVVFSCNKITDGVYNSGYQEIAQTTSDASGAFHFEVEEERAAGYRISLSKSGYFPVSVDLTAEEVAPGTPVSKTFNMYPIGYIKLHVLNNNPIDSADFISYTFSSGYLGCYECCDNSMRYGAGENVDDWLKCKTNGNQYVTITWNVTKNHSSMQNNAQVYCKAQDTVTYEIYY